MQIGATPGMVAGTDGLAVVLWQPEDSLTYTLLYFGPVDEALEIARSVEPVDAATWEAIPEVVPVEGCEPTMC